MGAAGSIPETSLVNLSELEDRAPELNEIIKFNSLADSTGNIPVHVLKKAIGRRRDVFLTHDWGVEAANHKRVSLVNQALINRGLTTWFDEEQMKGNIQMEMTNGIDSSSCILVFITSRYMHKVGGLDANDNCQLEFLYAARRKSPALMIPVVMESDMLNTRTWDGPIGLNLGGSLYVDNSEDNLPVEKFNAMIDDLYDRVIRLIGKPIKRIIDESNLNELTIIHSTNKADEIRSSIVASEGKLSTTIGSRNNNTSHLVVSNFPPLSAIEDWCNKMQHRNDKDRKLVDCWCNFKCFDWVRQPKNYVVDANKSITVGLGEYSTDEGGAQILIISHFDSERPGNYEKADHWGNVPPVWGVAFSCAEMKQLTSTVLANINSEGALIHREPEGDYDRDEPWWQESHWLIENGKITGIKLSVKCTQDVLPNHRLIRFKQRGKTFELIDVETIDNSPPFINADIDLPTCAPWIIAPPTISVAKIQESKNILDVNHENDHSKKWKADGSGLFVVGFEKGDGQAYNYDDLRKDNLCQSITTPLITLTNATESDIHIQDMWVEFQSVNQSWERGEICLSVGNQEKYEPFSSFKVAAQDIVKYKLEGIFKISREGRAAYNGAPHNRRIHDAFPNPLKVQFHLKDINENVQTIHFEYHNPSLTGSWLTYEDALAEIPVPEHSEGFGVNYQEEMFMCVENPLTLDKCYILVSTLKDNPSGWYVKMGNDSRTIGKSFNCIGPEGLRRLAYKGVVAKESEVSLNMFENANCKMAGLVDPVTCSIYAMHGVIHVEDTNKNVICHAESYVKLDYTKIKSDN